MREMEEPREIEELLCCKSSEDRRKILGDLFMRHRERLSRMVGLRLDKRLLGRVDTSDVIQDTYLEAFEAKATRGIGDGRTSRVALRVSPGEGRHRPGPLELRFRPGGRRSSRGRRSARRARSAVQDEPDSREDRNSRRRLHSAGSGLCCRNQCSGKHGSRDRF